MKKYMTMGSTYPQPEIREIEVDKETESSVWVDGRRQSKRSDWRCYFDSREEAKLHLSALAEGRVNKALRELKHAEERRAEIQAL